MTRGRPPIPKQDAAQKNGAAAVLIIQPAFPRQLLDPRGRMTLDPYRKTIAPNTFYIQENVARSILGDDYTAALNGEPRPKPYEVHVRLGLRKTSVKLQSSDVLGFLEGTDLKDQILVLSAHYDHLGKRGDVIWYGADDDGSGTVTILELLRGKVFPSSSISTASTRIITNLPTRRIRSISISWKNGPGWSSIRPGRWLTGTIW